ncbi:hypothetical protein [Pseudothauera lacus]|uniref:Uncharacterized protein n=1 Tax=Pseudothauera lacus TaxID=2136175 RepID=A0A2T4ICN4_9RHOO|nr:hypothetical protein [Pseudothauera lacus]PTD95529.1 hypothetical protein C8261_13820 [Pseudothauera lacus]
MEERARRIVAILEAEVKAICADAGLHPESLEGLCDGLERDDECCRMLSAPVRDALLSLLQLRRDMLAIRVHHR